MPKSAENKRSLLYGALLLTGIYGLASFKKKRRRMSKYFKISEFNSKDGAKMPPEVKANILDLISNLDVIRETIGKPVIINSGYRSPKHNKEVGGASKSMHMVGKAADIHVPGMSTQELYRIIEQLIAKGKIVQGGVGLYPSWIHYDIRGNRARW